MISPDTLSSLSGDVMKVLDKTRYVLTSKKVNLSSFLKNLRKKIVKGDKNVNAAYAGYLLIEDQEYERMETILSRSHDENLKDLV